MLGHIKPEAERQVGLILSVAGVIGVSADGLLVKLARADGASAAATVVFKYASGSAGMVLILLVLWGLDLRGYSGATPFITRPSRLGMRYLGAGAVLMLLVELCYTLGFNFTTSANVLAFSSLAPIWAALLSWPVLGRKVPVRTALASVTALAGSLVVGFGIGLGGGIGGAGRTGTESALGLACAIGTGIFLGAFVTLVESAAVRAPDAQMLFANLAGYLAAMAAGFALVPVLHDGSPSVAPDVARAVLWLCLNGVLCTALSIATLTIAGRLLPATEISLLVQVESVLGPLSTFAFLGEVPSPYTLGGGAAIVVAVATHEALALREDIRAASARRRERESSTAAPAPAAGRERVAGVAVDKSAPAPV